MHLREHRLATSVLVVGSGRSGLRAAIEVAEAGVSVLVIGRSVPIPMPPDDGSFAAIGDHWQQLAADTLCEGCLLADPGIVAQAARNGALAVNDLERYGLRIGRHGEDRDGTGRQLHRVLRDRARRLGVRVLCTGYITRLLVEAGVVFGAYGFDLVDGSRYLVHADAVILAAGGHSGIWRRTAAHRHQSTGDSLRLAVEAGARLRDAELVAFHPFGLLQPEHTGTLVSDAVRAAGGRLLNNQGERYMARYEPVRLELAGRDLVSRASYTEIGAGRGTRAGGVWLDLSHLTRETVVTRLPEVYRKLLEQRLDVTVDPIEVTPTAWYALGGVWVRPDDHGTEIDGLYVAGEAAGGLHGANLLAGNVLTDLLVSGRLAGRAAVAYSARLSIHRRSPAAVRYAETEVDRLLVADGRENVRELLQSVRRLMTEHGGVVRDESGLRNGLAALEVIEARMTDIGIHAEVAGVEELRYAYQLRSAVLAARATLESALERRETRGCHSRSDYPDRDPELRLTLVWSPGSGVRREPLPPIPAELAELLGDAGDRSQNGGLPGRGWRTPITTEGNPYEQPSHFGSD